jgi:ABC-2 type transport system permease protein
VSVVFAQTDDLAGWRQDELIALIGVFFIVRGLVDVVIRPSMERLMQGVRQGTLDLTSRSPPTRKCW